jgi:hypothetical protein
MKKTILILMAGVFAVGCAGTRSVQTNAGSAQTTVNESNPALFTADTRTAAKPLRNFWKMFGESKNEKWFSTPELSIAEFQEKGVTYKVVFDKKGNWCYTLKQYGEKELPVEVRGLIKSSFYDYPIEWVKEVNESQRVVYFVHVENDREWQTVLVEDGQLAVADRHSKDQQGQ